MKAASVVGVTGIKKILFEAIMLFSKRKLHAFETIEQAKTWLSAQYRLRGRRNSRISANGLLIELTSRVSLSHPFHP